MAKAIIFDENATPQRVLEEVGSIASNDMAYTSRTDALILTTAQEATYDILRTTLPFRHLKHDAGNIVEMTAQEKADTDTLLNNQQIQTSRDRAESSWDTSTPEMQVIKAMLVEIVQEFNRHRANDGDPLLTKAQVINAIKTRIQNGEGE